MEIDSWEIEEFNLDGHIVLSDKFGLIKIARSDDGLLILVGDGKYGLIDQEKPSPASFVKTDSLLGFILDIGIQKKKRLTFGHGYYFGTKLLSPQSSKKISQTNFDKGLFESIGSLIDSYYQSGNKEKEQSGIKIQLLLDEYNNARLLFPNFYAESYLSLMRIIDALADAKGGYDFAVFSATLSESLSKEIHGRIESVDGYSERITKAIELFEICLTKAKKDKFPCYESMSTFSEAQQVIFACIYSAYQYRNKFVHKGFPFPDTVRDIVANDLESGLAYLNPAMGISWSKFHRPQTGLKDGDLIDFHEIVGDEASDFQETYFLLLPTWHFMKCVAREALLAKVKALK